jgi:hypothetical protein
MKIAYWPVALGLAVLVIGGIVPPCSCNHSANPCVAGMPFPNAGGNGVVVGKCPDGTKNCIVLGQGSQSTSNYLWIADDQAGMVSKVDTQVNTGAQPNGSGSGAAVGTADPKSGGLYRSNSISGPVSMEIRLA